MASGGNKSKREAGGLQSPTYDPLRYCFGGVSG
jgi:hypothetical protein